MNGECVVLRLRPFGGPWSWLMLWKGTELFGPSWHALTLPPRTTFRRFATNMYVVVVQYICLNLLSGGYHRTITFALLFTLFVQLSGLNARTGSVGSLAYAC